MAVGAPVEGGEEGFFAELRRLGQLYRTHLEERPSQRKLARAAGVAPATVSGWLKGDRFPQREDSLVTVVKELQKAARLKSGIPQESLHLLDPARWREQHQSVVRRRAQVVQAGVQRERAVRALEAQDAAARLAKVPDKPRPLMQWHPRHLGVHPAVPGTSERLKTSASASAGGEGFVLPAYVEREHDQHLRSYLGRAADRQETTLVLIQGESSTGKTRTAYEAVRACMPDWQLLFPKGAEDLVEVLENGLLCARTVLWLNEAQEFLLGPHGEEAAVRLRRSLEQPGPAVIVMTLWPKHYKALMDRPDVPGKDRHSHARALLAQAMVIHVPVAFQRRALEDAHATGDLSLDVAVRVSREGAVTQALAAGPQLVNHYESADGVPACYGKAIITVAMDARRMGHSSALPDRLLEAAAPGYLTEPQRAAAPIDWFSGALAYAQIKIKNVVSPLEDIAVSGSMGAVSGVYRLADYLDQYGRTTRRYTFPPTAFWEAAQRIVTGADDLYNLADSARRRGRGALADTLFRRAADRGDGRAWEEMAHTRYVRGRRTEAEKLLWKAYAAGEIEALLTLAQWHEDDGNWAEAKRVVQQAANSGAVHPQVLLFLAQEKYADSSDETERLMRTAADLGDPEALASYGRRRMLTGDAQSAERLFQQAISCGNYEAAGELMRMRLLHQGNVSGAEKAARQAASLGDFFVLATLAQLLMDVDRAHGEQLARQAAAFGGLPPSRMVDLSPWQYLGRGHALALLADLAEATQGRGAGEKVYRDAAAVGDLHAMTRLAQRRRDLGDVAEAERLYRCAAESGHLPALTSLAWLRLEAGDAAEAEQLCRIALDAGEPIALSALAETWEETGRQEKADRLREHGLDADGAIAEPWLPA
ncbi:tetratricopeptide repeat protein [Streptomyces pini]|uniref:TPR repeat n=1 Tax=Streptomyces pini TaxID=1520580 RepID=A0A1I4JNE4_9ACTN|nr:hypothetical protein [Streptomyces pini]SFL67727.1 hypothetical protein SAMN05192584_12419 [Streptomyces pini]